MSQGWSTGSQPVNSEGRRGQAGAAAQSVQRGKIIIERPPLRGIARSCCHGSPASAAGTLTGHSVHAPERVVLEKVPGLQALHAAAPAGAKKPTLHEAQLEAWPRAKVPAAQVCMDRLGGHVDSRHVRQLRSLPLVCQPAATQQPGGQPGESNQQCACRRHPCPGAPCKPGSRGCWCTGRAGRGRTRRCPPPSRRCPHRCGTGGGWEGRDSM